MISLDIISDPVCPWCYIGKVRLDRAIAEAGHNPFDISWRMFRLNPEMPPEGMDRRAYLEAKFGGPEGAARVYGAISEAGRAAGIPMRLDAIPRAPATLDAHRLIHWSRIEGVQDAVVNALFARYFEEGEDISDRAVLIDIAADAGMDPAIVARLLDGDADRDTLAEEEAAAHRMGVTGVPCFLVQGRYVLQGAQETATWVKIIAEIDAALATAPADREEVEEEPRR